jgi:predicted enzyme related to lactoylglutathione lyase
MTSGITTIIYPVSDLATAKAVYVALLGVQPEVDESYYVGFTFDDQHIGLDPRGRSQGVTGPVGYVDVSDIEARLTQLVDAGATPAQPVTDVGGGKLIATVRDPDGNVIGLTQSP